MTQIGHINKFEMDIEMPIKMNVSMGVNRINLMVGMNATGKSLVLKTQFAMGTIMAMLVARKPPAKKPLLSKEPPRPQLFTDLSEQGIAQYVFDGTFYENNFDGRIAQMWENGSLFLTMDAGKVTGVGVECPGVDIPTQVLFMSSELRLFSAINRYLQIYNGLENKEEILKFYRLYDVFYVEKLKKQVGNGFEFDEALQIGIKAMLDDTHTKLGPITQDDNGFYMNGRDLATYSNGEQAILNMMLGASGQ